MSSFSTSINTSKKYYKEYDIKEYPGYRLVRNCDKYGNEDMTQCWLLKLADEKWVYERPRFTNMQQVSDYLKEQVKEGGL